MRREDRADAAAAPVHRLLARRRAVAGVHGRDAARALADAQLGPRRQHQLGIDEQVAFVRCSPSGSGRNSTCQSRRRCRSAASACPGEPVERAAAPTAPIEAVELLGQRAERLLLQDRDDALEPACSLGCRYTVKRLGASVEYRSGSRFRRMLSTTASMRSRAERRGRAAALHGADRRTLPSVPLTDWACYQFDRANRLTFRLIMWRQRSFGNSRFSADSRRR